jgi:hypothetical protein
MKNQTMQGPISSQNLLAHVVQVRILGTSKMRRKVEKKLLIQCKLYVLRYYVLGYLIFVRV